MIAIQEVTKWEYPNHIYITNDSRSKLHGYVVDGVLTTFPVKPLSFATTRRKFVEVENIWIADDKKANTRQVVGSNGTIYTITERDGQETCSCPGFKFRGSCKHLAA
jgi:hypothetical protein